MNLGTGSSPKDTHRTRLEASKRQVASLLDPQNVVIVGASDRPGSWANQLNNNLTHYNFPMPILAVNPRREEIWGGPCYPDLMSLPTRPDHLAVLVPAPEVPSLLRRGADAGARSATVYTSGFDEEESPEAKALGAELAAAIRETGIAVSGPNCFGNMAAASRLVTLMEYRRLPLKLGPAALVGQSGGVMMFTNRVLEERGLHARYIITSGNETGLTISDYIAFMAADPDVRVVLCYTEAIRDIDAFTAACRMAQETNTRIVMLKLGQSEEGKAAAMAHTGALAGRIEVFDAVAGALGVIRADTLDEAVEAIEFLVHTQVPGGGRMAAITLSGAYRGILLDAAARGGLSFPPLAPETATRLDALFSAGSHVGNPLDGGFSVVSSPDTYLACLEAMDADPNTDMLLLQEELPREPGAARPEKYIAIAEAFAREKATKPVAMVSMLTHSHTDHSRAIRSAAPHIAFLQEANKALIVIGKVLRTARLEHQAAAPLSAPMPGIVAEIRRMAARFDAPTALDEVTSKRILSTYGFATPAERLAASPEEAAEIAREVGFPVVLKAVSPALTHKTEAGAVLLNLADKEMVAAGWQRIWDNIEEYAGSANIDGMLVCQQVRGGVEMVLGLHRDPEMGLVAMVGGGGVTLELARDVAFSAPPISRERAADALAQTRASQLLRGWRGRPPFDQGAVIEAMVALGRLASDLGDVIESVDINPFVALEDGAGGVALDALVVLRAQPGIGR